MYQFMVATTRSGSSFISSRPGNPSSRFTAGGEISTMSVTSGTNKWASRFVVALQLAAWSAVGIVLLEKGISSLQKSNAAKGEQKITSTRSDDVLSVIPLMPGPLDLPDNESQREIAAKDSGSPEENSPAGGAHPANSLWSLKATEVPIGTEVAAAIRDSAPVGRTTTQRASTSVPTIRNAQQRDEEESKGEGIGGVLESRETELARSDENNKTAVGGKNEETTRPSTNPAGRISTESPEDSSGWTSSRKRLRFAHMNGSSGGAAAAVAMVAVGAVMLVLGPAVIVLRAIDERRQERRFLKLSVEEDLPPSYEQATGSIEQAPTYSSLNLDTIATTNETPANSGLLR